MEFFTAALSLAALAWAVYLIYAVVTLVSNSQIVAHEARRAGETLDRIEDMLAEEFTNR